jgi:hypothetical protein
MELLKSFLSSPRIWRRRRDALRSSILAKLPPELIIYIAEFLPPIAATSFSLCCRPIHFLLGINYRKLCCGENFDTFKLLEVLERDLPDHIACYDCKKLHAIKDAKRHIYSNRYFLIRPRGRPIPLCWMANLDREVDSYIDPGFCFTVFQMAMKRHRQGADPSPLLDLMLSKNEMYKDWSRTTGLHHIVDGSLLVRVQTVFQVNHASIKPFLSQTGFRICPHFGYTMRKEPAGGTYECRRLRWDSQENFESWGVLIQCKFCAAEFRIDTSEQGGVMVFTRRQNLREGKSPLDCQWQSHVDGYMEGIFGKDWKRVDFQTGSICSAFEGREEFDAGPLVNPGEGHSFLE